MVEAGQAEFIYENCVSENTPIWGGSDYVLKQEVSNKVYARIMASTGRKIRRLSQDTG